MTKYQETSTVKNKPFSFALLVLAIIATTVSLFYLKDDKTVLLIAGIVLLGLIMTLLIWILTNKANKLTISDSELLYEIGLLSKDRCEVKIESIRTIKIKQSFVNRIFSVGTIEIYTAGDNPEISAKGMPNPHTVREIIKEDS